MTVFKSLLVYTYECIRIFTLNNLFPDQSQVLLLTTWHVS